MKNFTPLVQSCQSAKPVCFIAGRSVFQFCRILLLSISLLFPPVSQLSSQSGEDFPVKEDTSTASESAVVAAISLASPVVKIVNSKKFGSEKLSFDWLGLDFVRVKNPTEKRFIRLRQLKGEISVIKKYVADYYPGYLYVHHTEKNGKCTSIVLVDKEKKHTFSAKPNARPLPAMRLLNKLDLEDFPRKEQVYLDLLALLVHVNDKKLAVKFAPTPQAMFLASRYYVSCAEDIEEVKEMAESLPVDLENPTDVACVCGLDFLNDENLDFYTEELKCDPTQALYRLVERAPCYELTELAEQIPEMYRKEFLDIAECKIANCVGSEADYQFYNKEFGISGQCLSASVVNVVSVLSREEEGPWNFIEMNQPLVGKFKHALNDIVQNSVSNENNIVTFHKVFNEEEDLKWSANWALKNLSLSALGYLIKENVYAEIEPFFKHRVFLRTENDVEWAYFYLQYFHKDTFERKQVYLYSFALEENKDERNARILDYLKENGKNGIRQIEPYWQDCSLRLYVAGSSEPLAIALHQDCLECVNDKESIITYLSIPIYSPHIDGFDRVYRSLTSSDLRTFKGQYSQLYERIGDVFVVKGIMVDDCDWYLENYLEEEYDRRQASEKGIKLEEILHGKGAGLTKRVAKHLMDEEFGFDPSLVVEYIRCEQNLAFLNLVKTAKWVDELFQVSCNCITPQNLEEYKPYFGHISGFQEKVLEGIHQSIEQAAANSVVVGIPVLSKNETDTVAISLIKMNYPVMVLNVNGPSEEGVLYHVEYPDGAIKQVFTNGAKVEFFSEGISSLKLVVKNQKRSKLLNRSPSSDAVSISVFDCPAAFYVHFKTMLSSKTLRDNCLNSSEDIIDGKGDWDDFKQVLGVGLVKFAGKDKQIDEDLELLALEAAQLYFNIAQPYYPDKAVNRVLKDLGKALEKKARKSIRAD